MTCYLSAIRTLPPSKSAPCTGGDSWSRPCHCRSHVPCGSAGGGCRRGGRSGLAAQCRRRARGGCGSAAGKCFKRMWWLHSRRPRRGGEARYGGLVRGRRWGSNPGPLGCQAGCSPTALIARCPVTGKRFAIWRARTRAVDARRVGLACCCEAPVTPTTPAAGRARSSAQATPPGRSASTWTTSTTGS